MHPSQCIAAFALALHPEKTRLIPFGRSAQATVERTDTGGRKSGLRRGRLFDFLGFTHICAMSRDGRFQLRRQSMRKRLRAKLAEIKQGLKRRRHQRIAVQGQWLESVVAGYFAYHAVPANGRILSAFRYHVVQTWLR
jgi:RNA-directed DNA polymerase